MSNEPAPPWVTREAALTRLAIGGQGPEPRTIANETRDLNGIGGAGGLTEIRFLNHHDQRLIRRHVYREGGGGVEGGAAAWIAEIIRADGTLVSRSRRHVGVEVGGGNDVATRGNIRRCGRNRSTRREGPVGEGQDIVAPISGAPRQDTGTGLGCSATADEAVPAQATFLRWIGRIQAAIHHGGRLLAR